MSIHTWKQKYYRIEAQDAVDSPLAATKHCIKKWKGLSPKKRKKHGLIPADAYVYFDGCTYGELVDKDGNQLSVNSDTCALCAWTDIATARARFSDENCRLCPLAIVRGGIWCIEAIEFGELQEDVGPYDHYVETGDPKPMLKWLRKAEEYLAANTANS